MVSYLPGQCCARGIWGRVSIYDWITSSS